MTPAVSLLKELLGDSHAAGIQGERLGLGSGINRLGVRYPLLVSPATSLSDLYL